MAAPRLSPPGLSRYDADALTVKDSQLATRSVVSGRLCRCSCSGCEKAPDARVHITYWEKWTGAEGEAMQTVVDAFNRSQDRIEVEYLAVSRGDQKTLMATAGGDPPDVAGLQFHNIYSFADNAALTPLDPYIEREKQIGRRVHVSLLPGFCAYVPLRRGAVGFANGTCGGRSLLEQVALSRGGARSRKAPANFGRTRHVSPRSSRGATRRPASFGSSAFFRGARLVRLGLPTWFGGGLLQGGEIIARHSAGARCVRMGTRLLAALRSRRDPRLLRLVWQVLVGRIAVFRRQNRHAAARPLVARLHQAICAGARIWRGAAGPRPRAAPEGFALADSDVLVIPRGAKHPDEAWEFIRYATSANVNARSKGELTGAELLCFQQGKSSALRAVEPVFRAASSTPLHRCVSSSWGPAKRRPRCRASRFGRSIKKS